MSEPLDYMFEMVLDGVKGAEGPVFSSYNTFFAVAPEETCQGGKPAGYLAEIDIGSKLIVKKSAPVFQNEGGIPAGCMCDQEENLWVADMRHGLLKFSPKTALWQQVVKRDQSFRTMQGCNDLCFDYDGTLWITAPAGNIAPAPYTRSMEEPFGSIYSYMQKVSGGLMVRVDTGIRFPNGIAVQHDKERKPKLLIVAETPTKSLWGYPITEPGKLDVDGKFLWGRVPGHHEGGPDGMDFDADGNLLVCNWGSGHIEVFGQNGGRPVTRIACPFKCPSNLHFHPGGSNTVYVTEHTNHAVWSFEWVRGGKEHYCELPVSSK